jgi:hypothetical protein
LRFGERAEGRFLGPVLTLFRKEHPWWLSALGPMVIHALECWISQNMSQSIKETFLAILDGVQDRGPVTRRNGRAVEAMVCVCVCDCVCGVWCWGVVIPSAPWTHSSLRAQGQTQLQNSRSSRGHILE